MRDDPVWGVPLDTESKTTRMTRKSTSNNWGPHFIVPTGTRRTYSGPISLRETLDKELLAQELAELGLPRRVMKIVNPWYYRKIGTETWVKIGESSDETGNFPVTWDTTKVENGAYEILGLMHVFVGHGAIQATIAREAVTPLTVENS
jgi:hypothetical protein